MNRISVAHDPLLSRISVASRISLALDPLLSRISVAHDPPGDKCYIITHYFNFSKFCNLLNTPWPPSFTFKIMSGIGMATRESHQDKSATLGSTHSKILILGSGTISVLFCPKKTKILYGGERCWSLNHKSHIKVPPPVPRPQFRKNDFYHVFKSWIPSITKHSFTFLNHAKKSRWVITPSS